jgi:hypothetical protein
MVIKIKGRKGQVTIFIVVGLVIVVGIVALFFLLGKVKVQEREELDPSQFIEKCVRDSIIISAEKAMENGGKIEPDLFVTYKNEKYNYLCYQKNYYKPCINHYPLLKNFVENEIKQDSEEKVKMCFENLKINLEKRGFDVSESPIDWGVEILPGKIEVSINKKISAKNEDDTRSFEIFKVGTASPLYELLMIAREIVNQESQFCNFEYNGFMLLYPEYDIKRIDYDDNKIYYLKDRQTSREFKFAVRSCVFAPGV